MSLSCLITPEFHTEALHHHSSCEVLSAFLSFAGIRLPSLMYSFYSTASHALRPEDENPNSSHITAQARSPSPAQASRAPVVVQRASQSTRHGDRVLVVLNLFLWQGPVPQKAELHGLLTPQGVDLHSTAAATPIQQAKLPSLCVWRATHTRPTPFTVQDRVCRDARLSN